MIVVRGVFRAKYGKSDELTQLLKETLVSPFGTGKLNARNNRILTDLSGPFFTVVSEAEYESFDAWQADRQIMFTDARFPGWFERMTQLVESGHREFYNLVE